MVLFLVLRLYFLDIEVPMSPASSLAVEEPIQTQASTPPSTIEFPSMFGTVKLEGIRFVYDAKPLCEAIKASLNQVKILRVKRTGNSSNYAEQTPKFRGLNQSEWPMVFA